ncbi:DNA primase [Candidatus Falkowbacteria bacterium CG10_big_fil_rev_8_21_14_0_10_43_10]|uniref:DNA primase n=1 Tax=Candidatus Falkowbacteria bacterium CG10_big_fil_rev_8_21_14_0_10_43_10 TaxID=1974567 RepID=A0A2H0V211_9BACT|nr:MAG: DNA primase [Candidatus Falkowbacteria bacterium CG10_big_fil_rev_8_21_14_0_10_43_10]
MDQKDEIKSRLDLVEVIREYIQLKPVGVNFQARCPFHREKTPSFIVSPERQIWRCFGCNKGGDVFSFVMEMEGLSFVEALRLLAPKAGVTLQWQNQKETSRRNRLLDVMDLAVRYYHQLLIESPDAKPALEYLKGRGLEDKTIENWQIGYSRDSWDDAFNFFQGRGFSEQEIFLAGLTVKKDPRNTAGQAGFYNRFRGRIMFPVNDVNGNSVAFSARISPEREAVEKMGKYINSPQTQIYDKSRILFGLDKAKQFIREQGNVIVVEGQMDVISSHQAGVNNVVASSGTALSADQIKLIKRYTNNILFSFDVDAAGISAANRQIEEGTAQKLVREEQLTDGEDNLGKMRKYIYPALSHDTNIKVIQVPGGKDPDECIRNNPDDWQQAIKNAVSVMDYYFNKTLSGLDLSDIARKKEAAAKILNIIVNINNVIEQDAWLRKLSGDLEVSEQVLREAIAAGRKAKQAKSVNSESRPGAVNPLPPGTGYAEIFSESLLALVMKFPQHLGYVIRQIKPEMLAKGYHREFYKKLVIYYNIISNAHAFDYGHFRVWLENNIEDEQVLIRLEELISKLALLGDKDFYEIDNDQAKLEIGKITNQIKRKYLNKKMLVMERQFSEAEKSGGPEIKKLMEEFKTIADEIRQLN